MSIAEFSSTVQSKIYTSWLAKLDKNIINSTVTQMRTGEQSASKTDFYITKSTVKNIFKTITGSAVEDFEAQAVLEQLRTSGVKSSSFIKVNGENAIKFESIGFDVISTKLKQVLDSYDDIQDAYANARDEYEKIQKAALAQDPTLTARQKIAEFAKIETDAASIGFGTYFNKGHVVSIATNTAKKFRDAITKASELQDNQKKVLIEVLDKYVKRLQDDDLMSANLPSTIDQEMYAAYTKSSNKYLVEIQCSIKNQDSGRDSIPVVAELRKLFNPKEQDIVDIFKSNGNTIGEALVSTPGSPSFIQLLAQDVADALVGRKQDNTVYTASNIKIGTKSTKIIKENNSGKIAAAKAAIAKLNKPVKSNADSLIAKLRTNTGQFYSLTSLQALLNSLLPQQIRKNMGTGGSRNVLNNRTGRFSESVHVDRMTSSRDGMISAFYTYMKYPYATFSEGGAQGSPQSRDPKLLIAKSIREIAATKVANRMRAVLS